MGLGPMDEAAEKYMGRGGYGVAEATLLEGVRRPVSAALYYLYCSRLRGHSTYCIPYCTLYVLYVQYALPLPLAAHSCVCGF